MVRVPPHRLLRQGRALLVGLPAFSGQGRLVALERSLSQPAVGGDTLPGLQKHHVALHQLLRGHFPQKALPADPAGGFGGLLLEADERIFTAVFRQGGDQRRRQNGQGDAHGFEPALAAEQKQQIDRQGGQQDLDDGVAEIFQQLCKKARPFSGGEAVAQAAVQQALYILLPQPQREVGLPHTITSDCRFVQAYAAEGQGMPKKARPALSRRKTPQRRLPLGRGHFPAFRWKNLTASTSGMTHRASPMASRYSARLMWAKPKAPDSDGT